MYPYLKWIVCGIICCFSLLIGVILFVGWCIVDVMIYAEISRSDEQKLKTQQLEEATYFTFDRWELGFTRIDFAHMLMERVSTDYTGEPNDFFEIRRDGLGNWFSKMTEETWRSNLKFHRNYDYADKEKQQEKLHELETNEWAPIHVDYVAKIEPAYQIFLRHV